jgi:hypothetical protein
MVPEAKPSGRAGVMHRGRTPGRSQPDGWDSARFLDLVLNSGTPLTCNAPHLPSWIVSENEARCKCCGSAFPSLVLPSRPHQGADAIPSRGITHTVSPLKAICENIPNIEVIIQKCILKLSTRRKILEVRFLFAFTFSDHLCE